LAAPALGLYHWFVRTLALGLLAVVPGCASPQGGFGSPDPAAKLPAIAKASQDHDLSAIPQLIESLQSDDPVVRMASIRTLENLTGQTLGYDYADPPWVREDHVREWVDWYKRQGLPQPESGTAPGWGPGSSGTRPEPISGGAS
jgi:hypothetical protein